MLVNVSTTVAVPIAMTRGCFAASDRLDEPDEDAIDAILVEGAGLVGTLDITSREPEFLLSELLDTGLDIETIERPEDDGSLSTISGISLKSLKRRSSFRLISRIFLDAILALSEYLACLALVLSSYKGLNEKSVRIRFERVHVTLRVK